jgi:hypothetical protein
MTTVAGSTTAGVGSMTIGSGSALTLLATSGALGGAGSAATTGAARAGAPWRARYARISAAGAISWSVVAAPGALSDELLIGATALRHG